jgi:hypothetical protein
MTEQPPVRNRSAGTEGRIGRWAVGLTFFAAIVMLIAGTAQFLFIPQNPFWTLTVIALDVLVIWALTAHPRDTTL